MQQITFTFEVGLAQRYKDMRECFASCVYQRGLGRVAAAIDEKPSNLSQMLSGERNLDASHIERYMHEFKDTTPAQYWAARHMQDAETLQNQAKAMLPALVEQLNRIIKEAS